MDKTNKNCINFIQGLNYQVIKENKMIVDISVQIFSKMGK